MSTSSGSAGESVLDRALHLLDAFVDEEPVGLATLSTRSGLPKSTALRLARTLVARGLLERQADGRYVLGLRLFELASRAPRGARLREVAQPFLGDLHFAAGNPVLLVVRDGDETVLVERLVARGDPMARFRVGRRHPLHTSAAGRVLLAHAPREIQDDILGRDLVAEPTGRPMAAAEVRGALAEVRRQGWTTYRSDFDPPVLGVAAPLFGAGHRGEPEVVGAVSVAAPIEGAASTEMRVALLTVTRAISRELGGIGPGGGPRGS